MVDSQFAFYSDAIQQSLTDAEGHHGVLLIDCNARAPATTAIRWFDTGAGAWTWGEDAVEIRTVGLEVGLLRMVWDQALLDLAILTMK